MTTPTTPVTTIDQHLRDQERLAASLLATIAPVEGDSDLVEITPYLGGRCDCGHAIRLRKQDVEVEPTEQMVACCGTMRRVFRVHIKPGAQVPAADHVRHVLRAAVTPYRLGDCAKGCLDSFQNCIDNARDESDRWACHNAYGWCLEDCRPAPRSARTKRSTAVTSTCDCEGLQASLERMQEQLHHAPTADKAALIRRISRLLEQLQNCGC
jgi:hypothetical protein